MIFFRSIWVCFTFIGANYATVSTLLGYVYFRNATDQGKMPSSLDEALKVGTSAGAIIGQLLFGFLCDKLGRKRVISYRCHSNVRCTAFHL
jgi:MFS family permease